MSGRFDRPGDALAVARALAHRESVVLAWTDGGSRAFVACDPVAMSRELDPEPELGANERSDARFPRRFGLVPYEARRSLERRRSDSRPEPELSLPIWRRYDAVVEITNEVRVLGATSQAKNELSQKLEHGLRAPLARRPARLSLGASPER